MKSDSRDQSKTAERRFEFGKNWSAFLKVLDESRIKEAEASLRQALGANDLTGKKFLDIGCGSGLFSLAAKRLGAEVHSFDYDMDSVACCRVLKESYFRDDDTWAIEHGSALDGGYMESLGVFDIVYSWGVLHHTGNMQLALRYAAERVKGDGIFYIALYNDQGAASGLWVSIKKFYCMGLLCRSLVCAVFIPIFFVHALMSGLLVDGNLFAKFSNYKKKRGMSIYYDWLDWLGGYPFETARIDDTVCSFLKKGFSLVSLKSTNGWGCNEFVFQRRAAEENLPDL